MHTNTTHGLISYLPTYSLLNYHRYVLCMTKYRQAVFLVILDRIGSDRIGSDHYLHIFMMMMLFLFSLLMMIAGVSEVSEVNERLW